MIPFPLLPPHLSSFQQNSCYTDLRFLTICSWICINHFTPWIVSSMCHLLLKKFLTSLESPAFIDRL